MEVRPAVKSEVPALARVWFDAWQDGHAAHVPKGLIDLRTLQSLDTRLRNMLDDVRVVGPVGAPIGFCGLKGDELYQLFVSADGRGTGAAQILMADAEARLKANRTTTAWLSCVIGNERAARFYRKMGWHLARTEIEPLETLDQPFELEVWIFEKDLTSASSACMF